jgi:hypothetical protein
MMARPKGSKNKNSSTLSGYEALTTEARIEVLANLIVDKIYEDLQGKRTVLKKLEAARDV